MAPLQLRWTLISTAKLFLNHNSWNLSIYIQCCCWVLYIFLSGNLFLCCLLEIFLSVCFTRSSSSNSITLNYYRNNFAKLDCVKLCITFFGCCSHSSLENSLVTWTSFILARDEHEKLGIDSRAYMFRWCDVEGDGGQSSSRWVKAGSISPGGLAF